MSDQPKQTAVTLTEFLLATQPKESKGDFTLLMMAIQTAVKVVEKNIRRAGIVGSFGYAGDANENATGDTQAKLDVISNDIFKACLIASEKILVLGSEEEDHGVAVAPSKRGSYLICFDPLDGSSNIDANVSVGSIWGIWKIDKPAAYSLATDDDCTKILLQQGSKLVSSGYAMYGSATNVVITTGHGVNGFTLDSTIGEFILSHPDMKVGTKKIYSVNEGNYSRWSPWFRAYVNAVKSQQKPYTARYIGSMVADVHRTILYGGVFCYPEDSKSKSGKLRYLYEAAPMAFLMEQAGGRAETGNGRILDVTPEKLHQRVPVYMGNAEEVTRLLAFKAKVTASKL